MSRLRRLIKNEKGQSVIEFAFVFPILMIIILGMIEFGWYFNGQIIVTSAAREGARVYATTKNLARAETAIEDAVLTLHGDDVTISWDHSDEKFANVTVSGKLVPIIGMFFEDDFIDLKANAVMRNE